MQRWVVRGAGHREDNTDTIKVILLSCIVSSVGLRATIGRGLEDQPNESCGIGALDSVDDYFRRSVLAGLGIPLKDKARFGVLCNYHFSAFSFYHLPTVGRQSVSEGVNATPE